jgi:hypothetical protein
MYVFSRLKNWVARASMPRDIVLTVVSGVLGWSISHYYYEKALADMNADAIERKRVDELVFRGIESVGTLKYHRDTSGKVTGVVVHLSAHATTVAKGSGDLSTGKEASVGK